MNLRCHECGSFRFRLQGSQFSTTIDVFCDPCGVHIAEFDQADFVN